MKKLLWWLIAGSRGGANRAGMIRALKERPYNAHQLSEALGLDYKTVRHHLNVLQENGVVVASGKDQHGATRIGDDPRQPDRRYGEMYFLSPAMEQHYPEFLEILAQVKMDG